MWQRLALLSVVLCAGCGSTERIEVTLQTIDVADLMTEIKAQKGKVVVVDVWGIFCPPCRKEFPGLVALHQKYAGEGLIAMSVSLDEVEDREETLAFLQRHRATFANYFMGDAKGSFMEAWRIEGVPTVVIFDRVGSPVAHLPGTTYSHVEKIVKKLL